MPLRVLIIDDHPLILDGLSQLLSQDSNFEVVHTVSSWSELLTALNETYDVLILDLNIQGKDSLSRIQEVTSKQRTLNILIYTSYNQPSFVKKAFDNQINGYLLKDTLQDELIEAILTVAKGGQYVGQKVASFRKKQCNISEQPYFEDEFIKKAKLTEREKEVMQAIVEGLDNQSIAAQLFISIHTVQTHRKRIFKKLNIHSATELVKLVMKNNNEF